jgi:hypothetical protein
MTSMTESIIDILDLTPTQLEEFIKLLGGKVRSDVNSGHETFHAATNPA